jgi:hypothetical protein
MALSTNPVIRAVYHGSRALLRRPQAMRIASAYRDQLRRAREDYRRRGGTGMGIDLERLGLRVCPPDPTLTLPADHAERVARVARAADQAFARSANCLFFPAVDRSVMPAATAEVPAVREGRVIAVNLIDPFTIDGLAELAAPLVVAAESSVFGASAIVDKAYVYRNVVSTAADQVSWRWHYDNHPDEICKIMVYLTDVSEATGPFEYLRREDGAAATMRPLPHAADTWISPRRLAGWERQGYRPYKVVGGRGTVVLFDNNVVHKANRAREAHRDVVVFQLRPATFAPERALDPAWTGSFQNEDFNADPDVFRALPKSRTYSG